MLVKKDISLYVNKYLSRIGKEPFAGVQIRVGNDDLREKEFSKSCDIELIINTLISSFKHLKWFVTGDSQKIKLELCRKFKQVNIFSKEKAAHYEKFKRDINIIIEHEILSKATILIISKSTFGLTALLKSGVLHKKYSNASYEVTNNKTYSVKKYFRYLTSTFHKTI